MEATLAKIMGLRPLDRLQFSALDVFGVEQSRHRDDCRREVQTFIGHAISSDRDKCEKSACAS